MSVGWNVLDAERALLWREYEFNRGAYATTLVFRGPDGLVVVSPCPGLDATAYDALASYGEVRALICNNDAHHLGQTEWRARFPQAASYAGPAALAALAKKLPGVVVRPIGELPLGPGAEAVVLDGYTNGELLVVVRTARGPIWYTGDLLTNLTRMPGPPVRWLFTWSGSAPGFKLFKLGVWFFVKDRRALRAQVEALLQREPPVVVVPGHGAPVDDPGLVGLARGEVGKL